MKNKSILFLSLILIAFVLINSYTPQAMQAEIAMQGEPVSEIEAIPYHKGQEPVANDSTALSDIGTPDSFEDYPLKLEGDNQINGDIWGFFNAVGNNFQPMTSDVTYYNGGSGCMGSTYSGGYWKAFSIPVNVPYESKGDRIYFTYYNTVESPTNGPIRAQLYRRYYNDIFDVEVVGDWILEKTDAGDHYTSFDISDLVFDTNFWHYYFVIELPQGDNTREICGLQISYDTPAPPLFPLAFPGVMTKP